MRWENDRLRYASRSAPDRLAAFEPSAPPSRISRARRPPRRARLRRLDPLIDHVVAREIRCQHHFAQAALSARATCARPPRRNRVGLSDAPRASSSALLRYQAAPSGRKVIAQGFRSRNLLNWKGEPRPAPRGLGTGIGGAPSRAKRRKQSGRGAWEAPKRCVVPMCMQGGTINSGQQV